MGAEDLNSGPRAFPASSLPTEPSTHCLVLFLKTGNCQNPGDRHFVSVQLGRPSRLTELAGMGHRGPEDG